MNNTIWGIDIKIGEDSSARRKLVLKIMDKFQEHDKSFKKLEKEAQKKLGLKKPSIHTLVDSHGCGVCEFKAGNYRYKNYSAYLIGALEYRLAVASYIAYKNLK